MGTFRTVLKIWGRERYNLDSLDLFCLNKATYS